MKCLNCSEVVNDLSGSCDGCGVYLPSLLKDFLPVGLSLNQQKYTLLSPLGRGGFGLTYLAEQKLLNHKVAIKEYFPQSLTHRNESTRTLSCSQQSKGSFDRGLERFLREGRILAKLKHPHIVNVLDLFEEHGTAYLVMEYLEGETLKSHLEAKKKLSPAQVQTWGCELVSALGAVHAQGVYHLDIKPDNVLLVADTVKLIDFGAAKPESSNSQSTRSFTLQYAAPEILSNGEVGAWSDIFELGMLLYELLKGEVPPDAVGRLLSSNWQVAGCGDPWDTLLGEALAIQPAQRPREIEEWWHRHFKAHASANAEVLSKDEKECPYCAEVIKAKAIVCRYCNRALMKRFLPISLELSTTQPPSESKPAKAVKPPSPTSAVKQDPAPPPIPKPHSPMPAVKQDPAPPSIPKPYSPTPAVTATASKIRNSLGMDFVLIQPGSFMMGIPARESSNKRYETQHRVTLTKGFYLQTTPVTQGQWEALMGNNPNPNGFKGKDLPVMNVSWNDCQGFIEKLNQKGEGRYRLPTEAEWEYACRAGSQSFYCYGDYFGILGEYAWYSTNSGYRTHRIGQKKPNAWGLYDMHGNVWEWVQDWFGEYPSSTVTDPKGPNKGDNRVLRGGCCDSGFDVCRSAYRYRAPPGYTLCSSGFRLLRS